MVLEFCFGSNFRYEEMKSKILAWENEKKKQAKLHMEKKNVVIFYFDF